MGAVPAFDFALMSYEKNLVDTIVSINVLEPSLVGTMLLQSVDHTRSQDAKFEAGDNVTLLISIDMRTTVHQSFQLTVSH
jgi:hypothetical protein